MPFPKDFGPGKDVPPPNLAQVPKEYQNIAEVFSKKQALSLPPHRPDDCAIQLIPGATYPKACMYSISQPEREAMETYIKDSLAAGHIRPSSTPLGSGGFFVGKKDGTLRPCIDYRGLNDITVRISTPCP